MSASTAAGGNTPRHEAPGAPLHSAARGGPVSHAIFRVARLHRTLAGQLLRRAGLHPGQEMLMMHLWEAGPQRQVDLVKTFDSDAAVITRTVARLERAGFVRRTPSPTDKRASIIASTTAGDALRAQVEEIWLELETRTVAGLSEQERSETLTVLNRLEKHLIERFTA